LRNGQPLVRFLPLGSFASASSLLKRPVNIVRGQQDVGINPKV